MKPRRHYRLHRRTDEELRRIELRAERLAAQQRVQQHQPPAQSNLPDLESKGWPARLVWICIGVLLTLLFQRYFPINSW